MNPSHISLNRLFSSYRKYIANRTNKQINHLTNNKTNITLEHIIKNYWQKFDVISYINTKEPKEKDTYDHNKLLITNLVYYIILYYKSTIKDINYRCNIFWCQRNTLVLDIWWYYIWCTYCQVFNKGFGKSKKYI